MMKICFIADIRSPIARSWISFFPARGHEVHILATRAPNVKDSIPGATVHSLGESLHKEAEASSIKYLLDPSTLHGRGALKIWSDVFQPIKCLTLTTKARYLVETIKPDIVHALRIPIEGELGARLGVHPFLISIWGNDLTLHASNSIAHRVLTRRALAEADGIIADAEVDLIRARSFGATSNTPTLKVPGCGGMNREVFFPGPADRNVLCRLGVGANRPIVLNARGYRSYIRNDVFLAAIPKLLKVRPDTLFIGVGLKDWKTASNWIKRSGTSSSVILTPPLAQSDLAELYRAASVAISPAEHDGTPNTLLETMACGCFPICGDLPSIREWITPDVNGILIDPSDPDAMARAIIRGLADCGFRERATRCNAALVAQHADYDKCMAGAEGFYAQVLKRPLNPAFSYS